MPEIPELQHVAAVLSSRLAGRSVVNVDVPRPIVVRLPREDFEAGLLGAKLERVERSGKFLLFHFNRGSIMAVNPMLTGRFQWTSDAKAPVRTCFTLGFSAFNGEDGGPAIRYIDERFLGKVYLVDADALDSVPVLSEQGPDALDPELSEDVFLKRMKRYRGQVKNALVNAKFIAGVGNAYADEILFAARIHPFTKISDLDADRRAELYHALQDTLDWASTEAAAQIGERIDRKPREFLRVHRKGGEPCPQCGGTISEVSPNRRITSFCRACQPG